ncbi:tRNA (adenosine(37)-N6)-threonylcarbamoyltransferase complex dimerization subunit type 1 TsaB [Xylophilus rhododendri]|uniref:tRNA (Adenosine(37)-N6)-threonylcarbamoyltransferase complex dimerization subunit type 1 TsaB n=1 Tax=Xylophilus rhododendri TaxID=2697032 RepID=A0A857J7C4_9BURK|nr:tRNA (adenosine(37)-N6)-threonylcarbamoyltransferase complex dimerization subunit type 1 TsaB [Xylophilus rhododendri]QHI98912.1 tRNA (adenosine(37)-N6)-threonylcarbamoyltransferase complex dimerization subunit type 1 TsaB [Xylophilus rhododendri]
MSRDSHRLLAFDTSTDQLSAAVLHGGQTESRSGPGGAQASSSLIPFLQSLLAQAGLDFAGLDAVVFGRGPGSFTGLRTACATAQGIAYGARSAAHPQGLPVLPVDTLAAVAEETRALSGATRVLATLDARMDEVYAQALVWDAESGLWRAEAGEARLHRPEDLSVPAGWTLGGNAHAAYGDRIAPAAASVFALPTAAALLRLAPALIAAGGLRGAADALPLYVRDKVAKTTAERAAERASAAALHGQP